MQLEKKMLYESLETPKDKKRLLPKRDSSLEPNSGPSKNYYD
jgi:hypothetical protein